MNTSEQLPTPAMSPDWYTGSPLSVFLLNDHNMLSFPLSGLEGSEPSQCNANDSAPLDHLMRQPGVLLPHQVKPIRKLFWPYYEALPHEKGMVFFLLQVNMHGCVVNCTLLGSTNKHLNEGASRIVEGYVFSIPRDKQGRPVSCYWMASIENMADCIEKSP
jgi:hypothetical protein